MYMSCIDPTRINVTVTSTDYTSTAENGKLSGQIRHAFYSPTHWSTICEVVVDYNPYKPEPEVRFQYGAGGVNRGVPDSDLALAMSQAFAQAGILLAKLGA